MMCASNLSGLGKAMQAYANDYNEQIPTANKWCDLLIKYADISPRQFLCAATDTHIDESSYAMNKAAAGKRLIELPNDLVLLFETDFGKTDEGRTARTSSREFFADINDVHTANTEVYKDRWNQVGGPELLSIAHHKEGCLILYADGHVSFEMTRDLDQLRWVIDDSNFVFPAAVLKQTVESYSHRISWLYLGFGLIIAALGTITFFYRKGLRWWLVLTIVILATGPGALFGAVAENIYQSKQFTGLGVWGGAGLGVIFAFAFVPFVISTTQKYGVKQITMYMAAVGMITGILCSTVLHLMLMIAHAQTFPYGIIIGVPFGIMSGAILGYIAGVLLKKKINFATEIAEDTEKKL
ncbi:MAG: hypothetical protein A2Y07_03550 [Planctomycetes bacterium GWF2_50_10]|nr:MAG: hypothetical protein A2Y07_03550 [Planctomycetes bacterium GWF2_50_10]